MATKKWVPVPRGTKRRCPKCRKAQVSHRFKRADPDGFCISCRRVRDSSVVVPESEPIDGAGEEIKIGNKVLRIRVYGDVVALVSGRIVERNTRENVSFPGGDLRHKWHIVNANDAFFSECSPLTVPLRFLDTLRAALSKIARDHPQSVSE